MAERDEVIRGFLRDAGWSMAVRADLAGDASARRYERLSLPDGRSAILMDAPPEYGQDIRPFIDIARYLADRGLSPPALFATDAENGLIVMEDLGDDLLARLVEADPSRQPDLYAAIVDMLLDLQSAAPPAGLPVFAPEGMAQMVDLAFDWYCAPLGTTLSEDHKGDIRSELETLLTDWVGTGTVFSLRDCHAENLLWLPDRTGAARLGLLDFQDAVVTHPAYDLVSLLRDARRDVPAELEAALILHHARQSGADPEAFGTAYAILGLQRNLRILGVFGRLARQLGKPGYLRHMPRIWTHVRASLDHPRLARLDRVLRPALPEPDTDALLRTGSDVPA